MKLVILAGGRGTRLKSIVSEVPKVLAPIGKKTFLDYQTKNWINQGAKHLIFSLNYEAKKIIDHIEKKLVKKYKSITFDYVVEENPLDTGGAINHVIKELGLKGKFLATNADTWLSDGMECLWSETPPCLGVIKVKDISRYGEVFLCKKKVIRFKEKNNLQKAGYINAGVFLFNSKVFHNYSSKKIFSLEKEFLPKLVKDEELNAMKLETNFIDIGIPEDYNRFCNWIRQKKAGIL